MKNILFLFLAIAALCSFPAQASEKLNGCFVVWPPYTRVVDGKPFGITVDVVHEAAKRADFELELSSLPWKRCMKMVQRQEMDFGMDAVERPGFIRGKFPSALYIEAFWYRQTDNYGPYKFIGALTDKRLALMQGYKYPDELLNAGFTFVEWVKTEDIAAQLILNHRVDMVYADVVVMQYLIKAHGYELKPMLPIHSVRPLYPMFNVGLTHKRDRFDAAMGKMHEDGTIDQIYKKHTGMNFSDFAEISVPTTADQLSN